MAILRTDAAAKRRTRRAYDQPSPPTPRACGTPSRPDPPDPAWRGAVRSRGAAGAVRPDRRGALPWRATDCAARRGRVLGVV